VGFWSRYYRTHCIHNHRIELTSRIVQQVEWRIVFEHPAVHNPFILGVITPAEAKTPVVFASAADCIKAQRFH
jgi:hypothetical protein